MKSLFLFSAAIVVAFPAVAQDSAAAPQAAPVAVEAVSSPAAVAEPQCELHVWPAERFQAVTSGGGAAFGLLGALVDAAAHAEGDKARRSHLASVLDSEGQIDALQHLNLVSLLKLPASKIVTHAEALDRTTVYKIMDRRSQSASPCYAELIVTDVFYQKAMMWGRSLRTSFMLREFNGNGQPGVRKTTGGNGLKIFPAKEGEDTSAADAELVGVFQKNFQEATENFAKQAGKARAAR
jgi:hypothetical protein